MISASHYPLRFAANLSFLFTELEFFERFAAAREAGFDAVEFHFPYAYDMAALNEVVQTSGVQVVNFNLPAGHWAAGERGIACHPDRVDEFRAGVSRGMAYAGALGCAQLNCLAGLAPPSCSVAVARQTLIDNLHFAAQMTAREGIGLLLEPLNTRDNPGYFVPTANAALSIMDAVGHPNLRLQYDIYHAQVMTGDLAYTLESMHSRIGHIQFADVPGRHEPGTGEINFDFLFAHVCRLGYAGWIAAEYKPATRSEDSFGWFRARA